MPKFDPAVSLGPWKGGQNFGVSALAALTPLAPLALAALVSQPLIAGVTLSYLHASALRSPLAIHPLLACVTWDPKPYGKYLAWNVVEFPALACIYVDYDDTPTGACLGLLADLWARELVFVKERFQPATSPKVEELHLLHEDTGTEDGTDGSWSIRVANRLGVNITDVLQGIFDFFASPLYVDELGEMHPRAVRIMEQQYFEKRTQGFFDTFAGYRKSDALLGTSYFNGIRHDADVCTRRLGFAAPNVFVLSLGNC
ncbi:hypothetical protein Q5752_003326 [Cryptotrichosporon argae]